jgi:hypothetical protein
MPVEHLWAWLREDVTYHTCYETEEQLSGQVELFQLTLLIGFGQKYSLISMKINYDFLLRQGLYLI